VKVRWGQRSFRPLKVRYTRFLGGPLDGKRQPHRGGVRVLGQVYLERDGSFTVDRYEWVHPIYPEALTWYARFVGRERR
jgi:hypothetical protein